MTALTSELFYAWVGSSTLRVGARRGVLSATRNNGGNVIDQAPDFAVEMIASDREFERADRLDENVKANLRTDLRQRTHTFESDARARDVGEDTCALALTV